VPNVFYFPAVLLQGQHIDSQEVWNKSRGILHNCTPKINELETWSQGYSLSQ
jgi:hypothetical protein